MWSETTRGEWVKRDREMKARWNASRVRRRFVSRAEQQDVWVLTRIVGHRTLKSRQLLHFAASRVRTAYHAAALTDYYLKVHSKPETVQRGHVWTVMHVINSTVCTVARSLERWRVHTMFPRENATIASPRSLKVVSQRVRKFLLRLRQIVMIKQISILLRDRVMIHTHIFSLSL